ncbi:hypothetical protein GCM10010129_79010 [Streptomyces fumigatiscleroticus]|nr:hypothetical protein GCM10010129_79010 [Streptomyces fumigatiscleroticus]
MPILVRTGLVVLVGPPASGKSSFVRALIAAGRIDEGAVVSSDGIHHGTAGQLRSEGATAVHDVPGRRQGTTPAEAAASFSFT